MDANSESRPRRGLLFVISSPSGAGKTSLSRRLMAAFPALELSVSYTTRAPRQGEMDGREYHFVTQETFMSLEAEGAFLEAAVVHGNRYGTPKAAVMAKLDDGLDVLFDIDWQGAQSIAEQADGDVVRVFILPPSIPHLRSRLIGRAQDSEAVIERRLEGAKVELQHWHEYDYVIVNEDLDEAYVELASVYVAERLKRDRNLWLRPFVDGLASG